MLEEREERPITTEWMGSSFEEIEGGPTLIYVTDNQDSMGEVSNAEQQEERVQH
jgi:hypothetical protein